MRSCWSRSTFNILPPSPNLPLYTTTRQDWCPPSTFVGMPALRPPTSFFQPPLRPRGVPLSACGRVYHCARSSSSLATRRQREPRVGTTTPVPDDNAPSTSPSPFYFEAGYALYAKRPSRPFPPPFHSPPSGSFSDPLSTHHQSRDRRSFVNGEMIRGVTNGDDAVLVSDNFIGANDGVGAWAQRERGHAAYVSWSLQCPGTLEVLRLIWKLRKGYGHA
jgi:hypothetical protein